MTQAEMYDTLCALTKREKNLDASYHAAFFLLSTDEELFEKAREHVSIDGISFIEIKQACRSLDEARQQLVDVAHNLFSWNSPCAATPYNISQIGYPLLDHVCMALHIANGSVRIKLLPAAGGTAVLALDDSHYIQARRIYEHLRSQIAI